MTDCAGSVTGHDQNDGSGKCCWCGRRLQALVPEPQLGGTYRTELDLEYRRQYDPDFGDDPRDV